ncbi:hypothetical protein AAFF_G00282520 [Aldrovandia affinis]|uniref:Uncharacterized protein n=1 Tax=Aldrovandia affinis TaxID=143900 RepID=A0AAD7T9U5_9TELE|nr:hypothetical protein AAFF_G00282520 [Aldrovandia affinis]
MENVQYQPELLPMQPNAYERMKDPREIAMANQVRMTAPLVPPPRDHVIWSLCSFLYMNTFCLGFAALYFSIKARDRKVVGDLEAAREYGSTARCLNIVALCLFLVCVIIFIILVAVGSVTLRSMVSSSNNQYTTYYSG